MNILYSFARLYVYIYIHLVHKIAWSSAIILINHQVRISGTAMSQCGSNREVCKIILPDTSIMILNMVVIKAKRYAINQTYEEDFI